MHGSKLAYVLTKLIGVTLDGLSFFHTWEVVWTQDTWPKLHELMDIDTRKKTTQLMALIEPATSWA